MVARDKVARLRMKLAEGGLPKGGGVGYEIFDKSEALGTTTFIQNINSCARWKASSSRTIRSLDRVQAARVHLVLPDRPLFSRDKIDAVRLHRAQGARLAGAAAGARHPPSGGDRGERAQARAHLDGRRDRQAARRRRRTEQSGKAPPPTTARPLTSGACAARSRRSSPRWSAPATRASRSTPISTSTASPRPRTNTTPRAASCARARRAKSSPAAVTVPAGRSRSATNCPARAPGAAAAAVAATRTARARKSSITRSPAPPRPR